MKEQNVMYQTLAMKVTASGVTMQCTSMLEKPVEPHTHVYENTSLIIEELQPPTFQLSPQGMIQIGSVNL